MGRTRNSNAQRGDFTRKSPKPNTRAATGPSADKPSDMEKVNKLPGHQGDAIKSLEFGVSAAGREFKEHKSEPDTPIVPPRPDMPNESARTDQDRRGGRKGN
jgi:hypothetical protein